MIIRILRAIQNRKRRRAEQGLPLDILLTGMMNPKPIIEMVEGKNGVYEMKR